MAETAESMRAVIMERLGKPRVLIHSRLQRPQPAANQALVRVHASSVNPSDLLLRGGRLVIRKPLPHILGGDLAGEIVQLGADALEWQIGDRVCAAFEGLGCEIDGGYAEYCALPAEALARLPDALDYQSAVAAGAVFASAYQALLTRGKAHTSDTVVIRGAGSSLGAAAVQIASARAAQVIAISPGAFAADLRDIGADIVLEDAGDDLVRQVQVATAEQGANIVLHCLEALDLDESLNMLCPGGRLVIASAVAKPRAKLPVMDLYLRGLGLQGAFGTATAREYESLLADLARGKYRALIDEVMPLSQARQAHQKLEKQPSLGKIVLVPDAILEAAKKPANWIPID